MGPAKRAANEGNKSAVSEKGVRDESVKEALLVKDPINLSDIESLLAYITSVTLKTLLLNLFDMTLAHNHHFVLEDLNTIVYTIGKEISPYLHLLVPALAHYAGHCQSSLNQEILQLFEMTLKYCGSKFGSESQKHVDLVIDVVLDNLAVPKCKEKSLDALIALVESSSLALPQTRSSSSSKCRPSASNY